MYYIPKGIQSVTQSRVNVYTWVIVRCWSLPYWIMEQYQLCA